MFKNMYESEGSWVLLSLYLFFMEIFALYYQHELNFEPCALCVQVRAAVLAAAFFAIMFAALTSFGQLFKIIMAIFTISFMSLALYLSYVAYQIEIGEVLSSCTTGSAFPQWLPLDTLLPSVFEAKGICGVSPDLFHGHTMNEALLPVIAIPLTFVVLGLFSKFVSFFR